MLGRIFSSVFTASAASLIGNPIDIFERRQHFGAHLGVEYRAARTLVDEAVRGNGHDQNIAELARGFQMTNMSEMKKIERAVRLNDNFAACAGLLSDPRHLIQRPHFVARAGHGWESADG